MKKHLVNGFLVVASIAFTFLVLEVGTRIYHGKLFFFDNFLIEYFYLVKSAYPAELDGLLGYKPKTNFSGKENPWGTKVTLVEHGIRSNGASPGNLPLKPSILCVGDSFTFGDEVNDAETWPAYLERILGVRTVNAGVFGYGLDQSILRAEQLVPVLRPDFLIVGVIQDDVSRCEYAVRTGVHKPYFTLAPGGLLLHKPPQKLPEHKFDRFRRIAGYSCFFHRLFFKFSRAWWLHGYRWKGFRVHHNGTEVACRLIERLADLSRSSGVGAMTTLLYAKGEPRGLFSELSSCVKSTDVPLLDPFDELEELRQKNPADYESLWQGHFTPKGNRFMARMLAKFMRDRGLVPGESKEENQPPGANPGAGHRPNQ